METTAIVLLILAGISFYFYETVLSRRNEAKESGIKDMWSKMHTDFLNEAKNAVSHSPFRMKKQYAEKAGVVFLRGEELFVHAPAMVCRKITQGTKWSSTSKGLRVTPIKGLSFYIGGNNGVSSNNEHIESELGYITLTDRRIIFSGKSVNFSLRLNKINNLKLENNSLLVDTSSRDTPDFCATFANKSVAVVFSGMINDSNMELST